MTKTQSMPATTAISSGGLILDPRQRVIPLVWAPGLAPLQLPSGKVVYIQPSLTKAGTPTFRFYPLPEDHKKAPPAVIISGAPPPDSKTVHVLLQHPAFCLYRTLDSVIRRASWLVKNQPLEALSAVITSVKHAYFTDVIDEAALAGYEKTIQRLNALLQLAIRPGTEHEGEVAKQAFTRLAQKTITSIKKEEQK